MRRFVEMLAKRSDQMNVKFTILSVGEKESTEGALRILPVASSANSEFAFVLALGRFARTLQGAELLSSSVVLANAEQYVWALRRVDTPIVLVSHAVLSESLRFRRRWPYAWLYRALVEAAAVRRADAIAAVGGAIWQYYLSRYPKIAGDKTFLVPLGVELPEFVGRPRISPFDRYGLEKDVPIALFVGRLSAEKNVPLFVAACDGLRQVGARFQAVVVGDGPQSTDVRVAAKTRSWLHWIPRATHDEVLDLMAVSSVLAVCSKYESGPLVLLEAVASGLPVVSTDVGRSRELLDPSLGTIVETESASLAIALQKWISAIGERGRRSASWSSDSIDFRKTAELLGAVIRSVSRA